MSLKALSPQLIIFRVTMGRSWAHGSHASTQLSTLAFRPNTFDHRSTGTGFDVESVSQEKPLDTPTSREINGEQIMFTSADPILTLKLQTRQERSLIRILPRRKLLSSDRVIKS